MKNFVIIILLCLTKAVGQESKLGLSELLVNSTIRIESYGDTLIDGVNQKFISVGTGFFFEFEIDSATIPTIITNYHVIKDTDSLCLNFTERLNDRPNYGSVLKTKTSRTKNKWIRHPDVDLAVLPLDSINWNNLGKNKIPYYVSYTQEELPKKGLIESLKAIEDLYMIGYPIGLSDTKNNIPITRKGTTATPIFLDYEGKEEFLLDIPIFSGSSGSPILLYNEGSYGIGSSLAIGSRLFLLGINSQSKNYKAKGNLILPSNVKKIETYTKIPIDIAIIIKSSKIPDFKPILKKIIEQK